MFCYLSNYVYALFDNRFIVRWKNRCKDEPVGHSLQYCCNFLLEETQYQYQSCELENVQSKYLKIIYPALSYADALEC